MFALTIIGIFAVVSLLLYRYLIHPFFLSPISKIPNAYKTSPILPVQFWSRQQASPNTRAIFAAHQKHGPVLRIGPNEISCVTPAALRTVYTRGFDKERFYEDVFTNYGIPPMFAKLQSKPHSVQKRLISNVYSKSVVQTSPDMEKLSNVLIRDRMLPIIQAVAENGQELDVFDNGQAIAMDFITAYLFGLANGTDFMNNIDYRHQWLKDYEIFRNLPPHQRQNGNIEKRCLELCEATKRSLQQRNHQGVDSRTDTEPVVFARLLHGLSENTNEDKPDPQHAMRATASEMLDHLIAGHETSAITLTYLMHELSKQPELQARLRNELLTLDPPITFPPSSTTDAPNNLPSPRSIDALPFLDSILHETLRLYAAGPAAQPRVTPHVPGGTTIEGYPNIPGGVVVSANAYTLHRNADVFPEPEAWLPERWLDEQLGKKEEMKRWFWAFGSGGRMCIGSNFSMQEMKLVIAAIYTNYVTEIVDDEGLEQVDAYIARPKGEKLILRFKHV